MTVQSYTEILKDKVNVQGYVYLRESESVTDEAVKNIADILDMKAAKLEGEYYIVYDISNQEYKKLESGLRVDHNL